MTKHLVLPVALAVGLALTVSLQAQTVGGAEVEKRTTVVLQKGNWSSTFDAVKMRAEKEGKLIFWLQLVGELDGGL